MSKLLKLSAIIFLLALLIEVTNAQVVSEQSVAYQINPAHTGATTIEGLVPPLRRRWNVNIARASYPLIADGKVFVTAWSPAGAQLYALSAKYGSMVWGPITVGGSGPNASGAAATYESGRLFVVNNDNIISAFEAATGTLLWRNPLPGQWASSSPPTALNGIVYTVGTGVGGTIYAISQTDGEILWSRSVINGANSSPVVTGDGVYVTYGCGQYYKFDPITGAVLWHVSPACSSGGGRTPVHYNGRIYARQNNDVLDAQTGQKVGTHGSSRAPAFVGNVGLFTEDGPAYFDNVNLRARDLNTTDTLWTFSGDGKLGTAPLVVNNYVYMGSYQGNLYAVDLATGQQVWTTNVGAGINPPYEQAALTPPLTGFGAGDGILVVPTESNLVAYEHMAPTVVDTTADTIADDGRTSLREAINFANANPGNLIHFNLTNDGNNNFDAVTGTFNIQLTSPLPATTANGTVVDGSSQTTVAGNSNPSGPEIILNGTTAGQSSDGLRISAADCTIKGLVIHNFKGHGISIAGLNATRNSVQGCYIGTDANGVATRANTGSGISLNLDSHHNTIGGTTPDERNLISGNSFGLILDDTNNNSIQGCFIGTDQAGGARLPNTNYGIYIRNAAHNNSIGGTTPGAGNVISGNGQWGVYIVGNGSNDNTIQGNIIGLNAAGTQIIGINSPITLQSLGVVIQNGPANNVIGGSTARAGNVISGHLGSGIYLFDTDNNIIQGNKVGTDITGNVALTNRLKGIFIGGGSLNNSVGGTAPGQGNLLSGNQEDGLYITGSGTNNTSIQGNVIGLNASATQTVPNSQAGIEVTAGAKSTLIGGTTAGARNFVSGNGQFGILISGLGTDSNLVQGNYIGTNMPGNAALPNTLSGVQVSDKAKNNIIGGSDPAARNLLSGNKEAGVLLASGSQSNSVQGNYIGTNASGTAAVPNNGDGVMLFEAGNNFIGGTTTGAGNLISGNGRAGVQINGLGSNANTVQGNYIGINAPGDTAVSNRNEGVLIVNTAQGNIIGGTAAGARNVISGNGGNGITISQQPNNVVQGNYIGTGANGIVAVANGDNGVAILHGGAQHNLIGGATSGAGNTIAFNRRDGVFIGFGGSDSNRIEKNTITHNGRDGVRVTDSFGHSIIANAISSNEGLGINLQPTGEPDSTVTLNDAGDTDSGPNNSQNYPFIASAKIDGGGTLVDGTLNSKPNSVFVVDLYRSINMDPSGNTEGETLVSSQNVTTDANGNTPFQFTVNSDLTGQVLTVTATDATTGDTSEFSQAYPVQSQVLTLAVNNNRFSENAGAGVASGIVTRNTDTAAALVLSLTSSDPNKVSVPATVTIEPGATTATFLISAVDNAVVDGTQTVNISAVSAGFVTGLTSVVVTDNETPILALSITPNVFNEGSGTVTATVTRNTLTTSELVLNLSSSNPNAVQVPNAITIPAGSSGITFPLAAVNDAIASGPKTVTLTASKMGFAPGTTTVSITDDDVPTIFLSVTENTFSEGAAATASVGTVTRNTPAETALPVNLSGSPPNVVQLPATVTIPTGSNSATFAIAAVDDSIASGSKTVTITASKEQFTAGVVTLTVTDNDVPALAVNLNPSTFAEGVGANAATGTITRNTLTDTALSVNLLSSDAFVQVPATVIIPAGASAANFAVGVIDDSVATGPRTVTITATHGALSSAAALTVTDNDTAALSLALSASSVIEGGNVTGTVSRNTRPTTDATVTLASSNAAISVPASIVIPAGQIVANFTINTSEDGVAQGNRSSSITATYGLLTDSKNLTVTDNEGPLLTVTVDAPASTSEGATAPLRGHVTRNTPRGAPLTVNLISSDLGEASVPATVTIATDADTADFDITAVNDKVADGTQNVMITAMTDGFTDGSSTVQITDDEVPTLSLTIAPTAPTRFAENRGTRGRVSRNSEITPTTLAMTVSLSSSSSRVRVPASVTIPAGAAFVDFAITGVDNRTAEGPLQVMLTSRSAGFTNSNMIVTVTDNEANSNLSISGVVKTSTNFGAVPVPGVTLTLKRGTVVLDTQTSNATGVYSFTGLPAGIYTVVATREHYSFSPASASITLPRPAATTGAPNARNIDFTGTPRTSIRGRLTRTEANGNVVGVAGVTVRAQGNTSSATARTTADGNYQITGPGLETVSVLPVQPGTYYKPNFKAVTLSAANPTATAIDFAVAGADVVSPTVRVTAPTASSFTGGATGTQRNLVIAAQASDTGGAGLAVVTATIGRFSSATSSTPNAYLNWTGTTSLPGFSSADNPLLVEKLLILSSGTWRLSDPRSLTLLRTLPPGFYGVRATALDGAGRITRSAWKKFAITGTLRREGSDDIPATIPSPVQLSIATAQVSTGSIQLRFSGNLDADTASDPAHYNVKVNGRVLTVESASYNSNNRTVTLGLPDKSYQSGDYVLVSWHDLLDAGGNAVEGQTGPLTTKLDR